MISGAYLQPAADVPALFRTGAACVVLDLSQRSTAEREDYARNVWNALASFRADTGLPHWIVLDEAQSLDACRETGEIDMDGMCLVSWQPSLLATTVRNRIAWHVELSPGGRTGMLTPPDGPATPITIAQRTTRHVRHWHKYVDSDLPPRLRFAFRSGGALTGLTAANLRQFVMVVRTVPAAVIRHHAHNGDFSRWLGDAYRDHLLSGLVRTAEQDLAVHDDVERTRRLLTELVTFRYLAPYHHL